MKEDLLQASARRKAAAMELFNSPRGRYLLGQALALAVKSMRSERYPETSNIADMELLGNEIFAFGYRLELVKGTRATC